MQQQTLMERLQKTSVCFRGAWYPVSGVSEVIESFTEPLMMISPEIDDYNLSKSGSMTKVRYRDRYFGAACRHQVSVPGFDFEQVSIHNPASNSHVTSQSALFESENAEHGHSLDLLLFEFTEPVKAGVLPNFGWLDIEPDLIPKPRAAMVCCVGYPGYRNQICYDLKAYPVSPNAVWGKPIEPAMKDRLSFRPIRELGFDPSGMSGGAVFGIYLDGLSAELFYAGMLTNASKKMLNFLPAMHMKSAFERAFD